MLVEHFRVEVLKLVKQDFVLFLYVVSVARHHEQQQGVALYVAQEAQTEPASFARAFYYPGNVGHYERLAVVIAYDAERRFKRCERIVCYLRTCA